MTTKWNTRWPQKAFPCFGCLCGWLARNMLSSQRQFSQSHQEGVISLAANRWTEMSVHIQEKARDPRNWPMHDFRALWTAQSIPFFLIKHSHVLIYSFLFKIRCKRNWWEPAYFFFWERWQETAGTTEAACCRRSLPGREGRILTGEAGKVQLLPEGQSWDSRTMALRADRAGSNKHPRQ